MRTGRIVALGAIILLGTAPAPAKPPALTGLFPPGAARGQTIPVEASGTFDHWPVRGWVDGRGVAIRAEKEKGKLSIAVARDAEPGVRWVRVYDAEGATSLRPFVIGVLPEFLEVEPNDEPSSPQRLGMAAATVNGRLSKAGDVDGFAVPLLQGETLVADVAANRVLGAPMDAVLQVVSPQGFVLAQNDDDAGRDPRIVLDAPASGTYVVRLFAFPDKPDSRIQFAGGSTFIYRLTLTTGGFLDHAFPMAVGREGLQEVEAVGWNIPDPARLLAIPSSDAADLVHLFHPSLAGTAEVRRVGCAAVVESEPNDRAQPQPIPSHVAVSGRIDPPGDQDVFRVRLRKEDRRVFRVEARALGMLLDPVLRILDSEGKLLAEADDTGRNSRDPERSFTASADGEYRVVVRDLNGRGGPRFAYLLSVLAPEPDFALTLPADRLDVTPGKPAKLVVAVQRKDGEVGPIEITAEDLPEGVTVKPATSKPGDASARSVNLEVSAGAAACSGPFHITGRTTREPRTTRVATAPIAGFDARTEWPWITIRASEPGAKKK
jgi:hypothetical protein